MPLLGELEQQLSKSGKIARQVFKPDHRLALRQGSYGSFDEILLT